MFKFAPYEISRVVYLPGTRPYIFYIEFSSEAIRAIGILEKIVSIFTGRGIPILQIKISIAKQARIHVFADLMGKEDKVYEIVKELERAPFVQAVWCEKPIADGIAVDEYFYPLILLGERAIIMRETIYKGFITGGWKSIGSPYAVLLYFSGFYAGHEAYHTQKKLVKNDKELLRLAEALFRMLGYGRLKFLYLNDDKKEARVQVYESFECGVFKEAKDVRGGLVRGLIAGWLAARWNIDNPDQILAKEVKCIAKGDPYCEYWITVYK